MNAIELLEGQHRTVEDLFEAFESASDRSAKEEVFAQIADSLAAHATIEEKIFYPSVYIGDMKDMLEEAVEEHLSAKRIIADLLKMSLDDEAFEAKVKVLKEQIEHHVEEEEEELFTQVREQFNAGDLETMGAQMEALFMELMSGEPRKDVPREIGQAAPLS